MEDLIAIIITFILLIGCLHMDKKLEERKRNWWENPNDNDPFLN